MRTAALLYLALAAAGCGREAAPGASPAPSAPGLARTATRLDGPWRFTEDGPASGPETPSFDDRAWAEVHVPHTWGARPRRTAWYRTRVAAPPEGRAYLVFEGVGTIADVYVNGERAGEHRGAYTRFLVDATPHLRPGGDNVVAVRVSNAPEDTADTLPSGVSKTLYLPFGGIYRKAWLLQTPDVHVDPADHGSPGVFATITNVTAEAADLAVRALVRNDGGTAVNVALRVRLLDPSRREVGAWGAQLDVAPAAGGAANVSGRVERPRLWSPEDPALYTIAVAITVDGRVVDQVEQRIGFRDFRFTGGGFVLNGKPIRIRGIGKHQETEHRLAAVTDDELREDFRNLKDLGVNMVRLAHYPHASLEYDLADEMGLLVWAENGHSNPGKSMGTGDVITREMIRQNYNHPSIVVWSVGNETGYVRVNRYAAIAREEDPTRVVTYASNTGARGRRYPDLDFIAHNTYRGWYRGTAWEFEQKALEMRLISENGAGAVITNHTDYAAARHEVDVFEPEEYRQLMAEVQYQLVFRDHAERIPMYLVWILRDFSIDKYKDVRNTKGLLTYSNFKKDAWYLFKAFLRPEEPVVHITSKTWFLRDGAPDNGVKVYSNRRRLTLTVNGDAQGARDNGAYRHANGRRIDNVFHWPARLRPGRNDIVVSDGEGHEDRAVVYYAKGASAAQRSGGVVRDLASSNPRTPAWSIEQPVQDQWPFYSEFDGTADNTFDVVPEAVKGAGWISTPRLSKPANRSSITFTTAEEADVFVMASEHDPLARALTAAGYRDTGSTGLWRDNALALVPYRLYARRAARGERVTVPAATADYVVLVRGAAGAPAAR